MKRAVVPLAAATAIMGVGLRMYLPGRPYLPNTDRSLTHPNGSSGAYKSG